MLVLGNREVASEKFFVDARQNSIRNGSKHIQEKVDSPDW